MLAETELDFTYKVPDKNLLSVRPQYSNRTYQSWEKYTGPHFNSALHISNDYKVSNLISKGCKESEVQ